MSEKNLPPNVDLLKLIYPNLSKQTTDYNKLTDEELDREKQRLLKELKESESASRKNNTQRSKRSASHVEREILAKAYVLFE